jgi:hypothetical protein
MNTYKYIHCKRHNRDVCDVSSSAQLTPICLSSDRTVRLKSNDGKRLSRAIRRVTRHQLTCVQWRLTIRTADSIEMSVEHSNSDAQAFRTHRCDANPTLTGRVVSNASVPVEGEWLSVRRLTFRPDSNTKCRLGHRQRKGNRRARPRRRSFDMNSLAPLRCSIDSSEDRS